MPDPSPRTRVWLAAAALLVLALTVRAPFWREALRTPLDGDTALVGLMALHPTRTGTTLWGQPYGSPLEAWLLAPVLAVTGPRVAAVRAFYFALGLLLVPATLWVARAFDPASAWQAATLAAAPAAYVLLIGAAPPPLYPLTLLMCAALLAWALRLDQRLARGARPVAAPLLWGTLAGLAVWTHLMAASVAGAGLIYLARRARTARPVLALAAAGLLLGALPLWLGFDPQVAASSRVRQTTLEHLGELLPRLHLPLTGLLGAHTPLICDDARTTVAAPWFVGLALAAIAAWALLAAGRAPRVTGSPLMWLTLVFTLLLFLAPARSSAHSLRFLTPAWLPGVVLIARGCVARLGVRRAWACVALVCALQLVTSVRLLQAWQMADRSAAPFLLADLEPLRTFLQERGVRQAYAEYATAYRLTFESGEGVIASPPWNERFRHHPLPYLDAVRSSGRVAWVLRDVMASDLPTSRAFERALAAIGGAWRREGIGDAMVYWGFRPPFGPAGVSPAGLGPAGDGDVATFVARGPGQVLDLPLDPARPLAAVTFLTPPSGPGLPRSFSLEGSLDGARFEPLDAWRPQDARSRPCWLNGHLQYPAERDAVSLLLPARPWRTLRLVSTDPREQWAVAEALVHPASRQPAPSADALFQEMLAGRHAP